MGGGGDWGLYAISVSNAVCTERPTVQLIFSPPHSSPPTFCNGVTETYSTPRLQGFRYNSNVQRLEMRQILDGRSQIQMNGGN